jgi:hypothetical protein
MKARQYCGRINLCPYQVTIFRLFQIEQNPPKSFFFS